MASQNVGVPTQGFRCDLCGRVCSTEYTLNRHRDMKPCKDQQAKNVRQPKPPDHVQPIGITTTETPVEQLRALKRTRPILRHIPSGATRSCAEFFTNTLLKCLDNDDSSTWTDLLLFAPRMLHAQSNKAGKAQSLATCVKNNLQGIVPAANIQTRAKIKKKKPDDALRKAVDLKLQDGDITGAVRLLSSEDSVASVDADTLNALTEKHPDPPANLVFPEGNPNLFPTDVTSDELHKALKSFPNGSGAGPDGLRPQHIREMIGVEEKPAPISSMLCAS